MRRERGREGNRGGLMVYLCYLLHAVHMCEHAVKVLEYGLLYQLRVRRSLDHI